MHALGALAAAACAALVLGAGGSLGASVPLLLACQGAGLAVLVLVLLRVRRRAVESTAVVDTAARADGAGAAIAAGAATAAGADAGSAAATRHQRWRVTLAVLLWAAVLRGLLLLGTTPTLSDDVQRCVWEGRVTAAGFDPYGHAPTDPVLAALAAQSPEWSSINHADLPAVYPPAAQVLFAAVATVAPGERSLRAVLCALDLALIALLALLLAARDADPELLALYAWHPLVCVEVASSGHFEPWALLPLVLALLLAQRGRPVLAGAAAGLSCAAKLAGGLPALFIARDLFRSRGLLRATAVPLAAGAVLAACAAPFMWRGTHGFGSLPAMLTQWRCSGPLFEMLAPLAGEGASRVLCAVVLLLWLAYLLHREHALPRACLLGFVGWLFCSPVVFPWYGLCVAVLLPLAPSLPVLLLTALLPLGYLGGAVAGPGWARPPLWTIAVTWGVPLLAWLCAAKLRASAETPRDDPAPNARAAAVATAWSARPPRPAARAAPRPPSTLHKPAPPRAAPPPAPAE